MSATRIATTQEQMRKVDFAAVGANATVTGTDSKTGYQYQRLQTPNFLMRAYLSADQTNGANLTVQMLRDGVVIREFDYSQLLRGSSAPGPDFPGFPLGIAPGDIQWKLVNTGGTAQSGAIALIQIWAHSLIQVTV